MFSLPADFAVKVPKGDLADVFANPLVDGTFAAVETSDISVPGSGLPLSLALFVFRSSEGVAASPDASVAFASSLVLLPFGSFHRDNIARQTCRKH